MKIDTNDFVKVATFALMNKKSTQWVYKLIRAKRIGFVIIDGVKFVKNDATCNKQASRHSTK